MSVRREVGNRIRGVRNIEQLTKVMKAVSMAKAGRAQSAVKAARPYDRLLHEVIGRVAGSTHRVRHPLLEVREIRKACFVVITADQGLSGGFDLPILRRAEKEARAFPSVRYVAVGRRGTGYMAFRGLDVTASFTGLDEDVHIRDARSIAHYVIDGYTDREFDAVFLVFSEFVSFFEHRTVVLPLIPVPVREEVEAGRGNDAVKAGYIFEPEAEAVLKAVLPLFVEEAVFHALTESKASEHTARLAAMDGASRSAGEIVERLTKELHRARQAAVTSELLDIVSSRSALE